MSTAAAIALLVGFAVSPAPQDEAALEAGIADALGERHEGVRVVIAGGPDGPGRLDADADGFVTREEFTAPLATAFDRLDADRDGRLSPDELAARRVGEGLSTMLRGPRAGPGGPGVLVLPHGGPGGDGEVFVFRRGGPGAGPPHDGPGERRIEIRRFGGPGGNGELDTDGDGKVSEAEFLAPLREAFQRMDSDRDGDLDDGERPGPPPPRGD